MDILRGFLFETLNLFNAMSPYLLFGFLTAGVLKVFLKEDFVARHLGTHDFMTIVKASIFGIPLPLCSCGVIPAALGLRKQGASKAAIFSFLISTPTTGVDSILATYALLGGFYAGFRVFATFIVALIVGAAALLIKDIRRDGAVKNDDACPHCRKDDSTLGQVCGVPRELRLGAKLFLALRYGFYDLLKDSGRSIMIGALIGGAISYFVPVSFVEQYLGNVWISMLVMMAIGIPMYVCSTGSIPVVAALMMKGLNPGAGFVFLITGPATNTVSFAVIAREFGVKSTLLFLFALAAGSLLMGLMFNWAWGYSGLNFPALMRHHHAGGLPGWVNIVSSLVLLGGIIVSWKRPVSR
jgi:uncharacterized membrane protein YraQ (UPF0718 family)